MVLKGLPGRKATLNLNFLKDDFMCGCVEAYRTVHAPAIVRSGNQYNLSPWVTMPGCCRCKQPADPVVARDEYIYILSCWTGLCVVFFQRHGGKFGRRLISCVCCSCVRLWSCLHGYYCSLNIGYCKQRLPFSLASAVSIQQWVTGIWYRVSRDCLLNTADGGLFVSGLKSVCF